MKFFYLPNKKYNEYFQEISEFISICDEQIDCVPYLVKKSAHV